MPWKTKLSIPVYAGSKEDKDRKKRCLCFMQEEWHTAIYNHKVTLPLLAKNYKILDHLSTYI